MKTRDFYTPNGWQGENYDGNLSIKDITAKIREYCKKQFPDCKFSVTKDGGSMTDSINIVLISAPDDVLTSPNCNAQFGRVTEDDKRLTPYGVKVLVAVYKFANSFNYDDSDSMTDYFDTRFYLWITVGKWDKPFKVVPKTEKTDVAN